MMIIFTMLWLFLLYLAKIISHWAWRCFYDRELPLSTFALLLLLLLSCKFFILEV